MSWLAWAAFAGAWIALAIVWDRMVCGPRRCPGATDSPAGEPWWSRR
jgi:hypothetical protein